MSVTTTVLFATPQAEVATLIAQRMSQADAVSIVTGFATPGGVASIAAPIRTAPHRIKTFIVGSATYKGFQALDDLIAVGVPRENIFVHLGHTRPSGSHKHPTVRFHPMLHSKIYYMELPGGQACAFIGSHNVTTFALTGLNGEAAVLLEGPVAATEFAQVRQHITAARLQAVPYSSDMKEAFAWWTREFIDGLRVEVGLPSDSTTVRTILIFAVAAKSDRPATSDQLYFEIPTGVEQIESLKTETHLFLFDSLPPDPWAALESASKAAARYTCTVIGAENEQGNREVKAHWRIDGMTAPVLKPVTGQIFRPSASSGMQQVRAKVTSPSVTKYEYLFNRERAEWEPEYAAASPLVPSQTIKDHDALQEAFGGRSAGEGWQLVKRLVPRGSGREKDYAALALVAPESGSFLLVSLRRRKQT